MATIRSPENVTAEWKKVYSFGFGTVGIALSLLSMILIIVWLASEEGGGLGQREDSVTAAYFNWHPLLMSLAFLALMTPATSAFEVYAPFHRNVNKNIHATMQTLAVVLVICGYAIIYDCHVGLGDAGLANSMHSVAGYLTMSFVALNYSMALVLYVLKWGGSWRGTLKPLHKRLGILSLLMGYATILMGMTEKANGSEGATLVLTQVVVGLIVLTTLSVTFSIVKFVDKKGAEHKYERIPDAAVDREVVAIGANHSNISNRRTEDFV